ncbi:MAG: Unknown protein [uncultured Sulfurovum sp.]|uniref:DUF1501 domain-containing protein n=1 Tax=uncultured Sulfurovum sp. TaxID=269237 RepID=A0A6S6U1V4_9BACT|nr:MAG: Unknown protein [uncultured Sulfurovum sp.]
MKRRNFIKLSMLLGSAVFVPTFTYSKKLDINEIVFSTGIHNANEAQTIIIFQYGGASQLGANLTNLDEINTASQTDYDYFGTITKTENSCWEEAGGEHMETLLASGDMTLFRSCYSQVREDNNNKAHGLCTAQNQKGSFDDDNAGVLTNLAQILEANGIVDENTIMPFITLEGESRFYTEGELPLNSYLKPVALNEDLDNPYSRYERDWRYYTSEESSIPFYNDNNESGFDATLHQSMDALAQSQNQSGKIKNAFERRASLSDFIDNISTATTPDLGADAYPENSQFADRIETAVKVLSHNPDTKVITVGAGGLGGWDDHNNAREYVDRLESLFSTLKSAMAHIKAMGKEQQINIMVFGEFGRNVNLNAAQGWDHGNLQNFYVLGGQGYFNHKGIVGETVLEDQGGNNRLYLKPKPDTYTFEPMSIAATLYKIYGIENPETLTNNNGIIDPLFT